MTDTNAQAPIVYILGHQAEIESVEHEFKTILGVYPSLEEAQTGATLSNHNTPLEWTEMRSGWEDDLPTWEAALTTWRTPSIARIIAVQLDQKRYPEL